MYHNYLYKFSIGSTGSLKKICQCVTEEKSFKGVDGPWTDNGRQVITIAHPEPCSGELIIISMFIRLLTYLI